MRAIWKGSISFGLVYIPVAVYPATREEKIAFKQLRKDDLSPIRYKKVAEVDDKEVAMSDIVKGFEHEKGKFIVLKDEDFDKVRIESTHAIAINDFVELEQINPKFFYKPYFLEPQKGGEKGYALLHRALVETAKVGIAKVAIKSREYLAAVRTDGFFLMLELMHFAQEVLEPENLKSAEGPEIAPRELEMAITLVDALTTDWAPEKYEDQYQTALRSMIEEKVQNKPAQPSSPERELLPTGDIVAILQRSLQGLAVKEEAKAARPVRATRPRGTTPAAVKVPVAVTPSKKRR